MTEGQVSKRGCSARTGRSLAGGCRCVLAWCSCPSVARGLVFFFLAFLLSPGDVPKNDHFRLATASVTFLLPDGRDVDPRTGTFRNPLCRSLVKHVLFLVKFLEFMCHFVSEFDTSALCLQDDGRFEDALGDFAKLRAPVLLSFICLS